MTDAVWSPGLKQNIGYVWVPIELAEPGTTLDVESENGAAHRHDGGDPVRRPQEGGARRAPRVDSTRSPRQATAPNDPRRAFGQEKNRWPLGTNRTRRTDVSTPTPERKVSCHAPTLSYRVVAARRSSRGLLAHLGDDAAVPIRATGRRHLSLAHPDHQGAGRGGRRTCAPRGGQRDHRHLLSGWADRPGRRHRLHRPLRRRHRDELPRRGGRLQDHGVQLRRGAQRVRRPPDRADCEHDLAVLKIDATDLPTVPLGDSADLRSASESWPSATPWPGRWPDRDHGDRLVARPHDPGAGSGMCDPRSAARTQTRTYPT